MLLDLDRHTLVGKDSEGRTWKVHILLNRGINVEDISLDDHSLGIAMKLAEPKEEGTTQSTEPSLQSLEKALWQPGMGDGKIFAYGHIEEGSLDSKHHLEVKTEFWIAQRGLHIRLYYQGTKPFKMGWIVQKSHQQTDLNRPETFHCSDSKENKFTWKNTLPFLPGHGYLEVIEADPSVQMQKDSISIESYIDSTLVTSFYQGTLELLFSFTPLNTGKI